MNGWTLGIGAVAVLIILYLLTTRNQTTLEEPQLSTNTPQLGRSRIATGGYENTQRFELSNFDPDTFMPRTITIHREVKPT